ACFLFFITSLTLTAQIHPLINAHSHNDYKQKHPLSDALNNGFLSVEADIFLINDELFVSHVYPVLRKRKTLEFLYLQPLYDSIIKHHGTVYENNNTSLVLLIDIKSDASATCKSLDKLLYKYRNILTAYENGKITKRAITVIITGNKPYKELKDQSTRFAFIDQSLLSLDDSVSNFLCPLASTKYSNVLSWKGKGAIPENEKKSLIALVTQAHRQNKKVRLWASPENKNTWKELLDCGVDLINTDELEKLKVFLIENGK
ncbi:MAG: phosphatidylinositol-specific phospholipase C/glycerophosphodiester phosphodiesterase family protein, partial [Bacteroidia bacterium]